MSRRLHLAALAGLITHHGIELGCGVGLPGEPVLGRRLAATAWSGGFVADVLTADRPVACLANGAYQALALQHYVDWPWRRRAGLPVITAAEGLPDRVLGVYNAALLLTVVMTGVDSVRRGRWGVLLHAAGLATLPLQLASARHHRAWLDDQDRPNRSNASPVSR